MEGGIEVALRLLDLMSETDRVLHRHAGALGKVLMGRMRGVAEKGDAAVGPIFDRLTVT